MKKTAVELLIEQIKSKADKLPTNTKENRMAKGIYVDCLLMARQAKEMEKKKPGYSEEEVYTILRNFRTYFLTLGEVNDLTLNNWFEQFKNK